MEHSGDGTPRTWVVLDDLASLNRLRHLQAALVSDRAGRMPMVLCVHGRSLIDARYGAEAEALLSRPATKLFFRTREPRAAAWIAATVGHRALERLVAAHSRADGHVSHWESECHIESLVLDSEIMSLATGRAVLTAESLVAPLVVGEPAVVVASPAFLPRPAKPWPTPTPPALPEPTAATDQPPLLPPLTPESAPRVYR
jgi:type IV secretory pathway TraG/TraD family ATPase VirD4